jgi:hypothetical protein
MPRRDRQRPFPHTIALLSNCYSSLHAADAHVVVADLAKDPAIGLAAELRGATSSNAKYLTNRSSGRGEPGRQTHADGVRGAPANRVALRGQPQKPGALQSRMEIAWRGHCRTARSKVGRSASGTSS